MVKKYFKKALPHLIAVLTFIVVAFVYFSPSLEGYQVKQHDIDNHKGMSNEVMDHRAEFDEEPLWTNSMFGGMPATQISVIYKSNLLRHVDKLAKLGLPHPVNYLWLYMIGFYILMMCMKVDPWLAIVAAIAYGFSTYFFIIMEQGHNSKAVAVAYMAPALGGFLLAFRDKLLLGAGVFALFITLQVGANHPQVTYYFFMLLGLVGIHEIIRLIKKSETKRLLITLGLVAAGAGLAVITSLPNIMGTKEYAQYSQRAGSELTPQLTPDQMVDENGNQLSEEAVLSKIKAEKVKKDKEYKLQWSFSKGETWVFMIPNAKGGGDGSLAQDEDFIESEGTENLKKYMQSSGFNSYWGDQTSSAGPVYIGAIVCLLFLLGMVFWKNNLKWPLFILTLIAVMLSWGKNMMWFNDLFWENAPLYSSFRAVTIILVMAELTIPIVGFLWLRDLVKQKDWFSQKFAFFGKFKTEVTNKMMLIYVSGGIGLLLLLFSITPGTFFDFVSENEKQNQFNETAMRERAQQQSQDQDFLNKNKITAQQFMNYYEQNVIALVPKAKAELNDYRAGVFASSALRTLFFVALTILLIFFFVKNNFDKRYFFAALGLLVLIDLWPVDKKYLGNEEGETTDYAQWQPGVEKLMPFLATPADLAILENEARLNPEIDKEIKSAVTSAQADNDDIDIRKIQRIQFGKLNRLTNYRVLDMRRNLANSPQSSYFHKSMGGYHSAKLQRFQDILERKLNTQFRYLNPQGLKDAHIINMFNVKYIQTAPLDKGKGRYINMEDPTTLSEANSADYPGFLNVHAMGNAWFVPAVRPTNSPDEEFSALDSLKPAKYAITDESYEKNKGVAGEYLFNNNAKITLKEYRANLLVYEVSGAEGSGDYYAVFSEMYYPLGWKAEIDGKPVDINRVNYTLRGLKVPAGAKEIKMYFELDSFNRTSNIALAGSSALLLFVVLMFFLSYRRRECCKEESDLEHEA